MPSIPLAPHAYARDGYPAAILQNLFTEVSPDGPDQGTRRFRPGLVAGTLLPTGPVKLITRHKGAVYALSGQAVYRNGVAIGAVAPGGRWQSAKSDEQLVFVAGRKAYLIGEATVTQIASEALPDVSGVAYLAGRFIYPNWNSGQYHYSDQGDAASIGGLNYATAESDPDPIIRTEILGSQIAFFGEDTVEWHSATGNNDAPFRQSQGRTYDKGTTSPYSVVRADNSLFFVGVEKGAGPIVFRSGAIPVRVSDHSVEAALSRCADLSLVTAFTAIIDGHTFVVFNVPGLGSYGLDLSTNLWCGWASYGRDIFRVRIGDGNLYGDDETGQLWTLNTEATTDGTDPIICSVTAFAPQRGGSAPIGSVALQGSSGQGSANADGVASMRYYDAEWSEWRTASIGKLGDRSIRAEWRRLGQLRAPGRLFQFRWEASTRFIPWNVLLNERP